MAKDPYKLLDVSKSATDAEIKKAYRALAKKLHPDVNPGDEAKATQFKEITAAYTLLSDKALRAQYDSGKVDASGQQQNPFAGQNPFGGQAGGRGGFQNAQFGGGDDMADLFSSLFGMQMGAGPGAQRRSQGRSHMKRPQKGADVRYKLTVSFADALSGAAKRVRMADGQTLDVKIPKGTEDGVTLRLRGKGHAGVNGGPRGDAKVEITVTPHKSFALEGKNIRLSLPISIQEAVLGAKVRVPLPGGALSLSIPAGTNAGKTFRVKGKGLKGGDLLVTVQLVMDDPAAEGLQTWAEATGVSSDNSARAALIKSIEK